MRTTKTQRTVKELSEFLAKTGYTVEVSMFSPHRINIREPSGTVKPNRMRLMPRKATKIAYAIHARYWGLISNERIEQGEPEKHHSEETGIQG